MIQLFCKMCGEAFERYPSQRRVYCSRRCFALAMVGKVPHNKGLHHDPAYFWSFVDRSGECWIWTGHRNAAGYGHISVDGKLVLAHRHAWTLENGPIPPGLDILHRCDNPPCCRPAHLRPGTDSDNALDRERRGRGHNQRIKGSRRIIYASG